MVRRTQRHLEQIELKVGKGRRGVRRCGAASNQRSTPTASRTYLAVCDEYHGGVLRLIKFFNHACAMASHVGFDDVKLLGKWFVAQRRRKLVMHLFEVPLQLREKNYIAGETRERIERMWRCEAQAGL